ncbi:MAG TPA: UDP-N-acetylglucosamine 1-carboxyvinyltransferase, partial [Dehalococcoidia bacterium]|nr:UDP-N-acetylglucosamine 1-carboxyvinyltransferase [Dehalococcoidia bacterium]
MKPAGLHTGDRFRIQGGRRLEGVVEISGAKNAALPSLAATLLTADECVVENVPAIDDMVAMAEILRSLGAEIERDREQSDVYRVRAVSITETTAPTRLVMALRASFLVMGALLGRFGEAACSPPGGDVLGQRPLDVHLAGFARLGATVTREGDKFVARARQLRGARVFMDYPSVLGTENILLAAVLARGTTEIVNAAAEPEIVDLAAMLNDMGARISGAGHHTITVEGVEALHGTRHAVIPDRIEAGTFALAVAAAGGEVDIRHAVPEHLVALRCKLEETGVHWLETEHGLRITREGRLRPTQIQAVPYPGLATDLQAPMSVVLTQADGVSFVHERVYDN